MFDFDSTLSETAYRFRPDRVKISPVPDGVGSLAGYKIKRFRGERIDKDVIRAQTPDHHVQRLEAVLKL